jgi:MoxR-like ATPase
MTGNDGRNWYVAQNSNGVQRWVQIGTTSTSIPISKSTLQSMNSSSTTVNSENFPKFKVGDKVKITHSGAGCGKEDLGNIVEITEVGWYGGSLFGYKINPAYGNTKHGFFNGYIAENSFELAEENKIEKQTLTKEQLNNAYKMAKANKKIITKRTAQEVRKIETSLINKEEVFKMLALAEATGLPCLLIGEPGVAKTKTVIEYAKAWLNKDGNMTAEDFANKIYILETDEGTKASEIKGMPDLSVLFTENKYQLNAPVTEAEIVIINEVDKASSAIRNAMLGVMNEKFLFNGKHKTPCKWKLFVATCNEIPKEEKDSPFWDRFMLKMKVNRVSAGELVKYYQKGARNYREKFSVGIPSVAEIESFEVPTSKLEKYLEVGYNSSSDRTLTFVPKLTKAVSYIWDVSIDKALVKTAQIMIDQKAGSELQNKLMSSEIKAVMSKVEMLQSFTTNEQLELAIADIESLINTYVTRNIMDETQVEEIELSMQYILSTHPARKDMIEADLEETVSQLNDTAKMESM